MKKLLIAAAGVLFLSSYTLAFGPHDNNCKECHSLHKAKGKAIIGVAPNVKEKNPSTGRSAEDDLALCLGCHNEGEGIMPIFLSSTHPVGMKPNKVKVPAELLRDNGAIGCVSCHEPHPSNPNYKYLRFPAGIAKSGEMGKFCAMCHQEKVDMNLLAPKAAAPAAPAPAKKN